MIENKFFSFIFIIHLTFLFISICCVEYLTFLYLDDRKEILNPNKTERQDIFLINK